MYVGLIARRYATALYAFAAANAEEERACEEVRRLIVRYREHPSIRTALFSPVLSVDDKLELIRKLFGGAPCMTLERFIRLVIVHHRERYLFFMFNSFIAVYEERHNIREATLATASSVDEAVVERICEEARTKTGGEIHLRHEIRPELLGGFVLRLGDMLIDASIAGQLERLKRKFREKPDRIV